MRKYDLVCFDMDGTLTKLRSSWCWVHQHFEVDNEPAYQAFCSGEIDEPEFMRRDIALWKGKKPDVSIMDIALTFRDMPLIEGIQETIACLNECHIKAVIVSGGIDLAASMIAREFGFDDYVADELCADGDGRLTGEGKMNVDLRDKAFTDIGMFRESGLSIAFNPTDVSTQEAADHTLFSDNISDVLDYILVDDHDGFQESDPAPMGRRMGPKA